MHLYNLWCKCIYGVSASPNTNAASVSSAVERWFIDSLITNVNITISKNKLLLLLTKRSMNTDDDRIALFKTFVVYIYFFYLKQMLAPDTPTRAIFWILATFVTSCEFAGMFIIVNARSIIYVNSIFTLFCIIRHIYMCAGGMRHGMRRKQIKQEIKVNIGSKSTFFYFY